MRCKITIYFTRWHLRDDYGRCGGFIQENETRPILAGGDFINDFPSTEQSLEGNIIFQLRNNHLKRDRQTNSQPFLLSFMQVWDGSRYYNGQKALLIISAPVAGCSAILDRQGQETTWRVGELVDF